MIIDATQASAARSGTYSTHLLATWQHSRPCCPLIILHCCLGDQVNICRVMYDFDEGPPNNLPPPPPIPGIKEYKRKYEECKKTFLNPRKPKGLRPLLAALLLVLGAQAQLGPKCQLALLLPRPPPPAPPWRAFRSSCRLGSCLCNGCCPQEVTLTHWWSCGNFFASVPTNK